jgi:hypothetical protein
MKYTYTTAGTTFVNVEDLPNFLAAVNEVDPGRFIKSRGSLWFFCDNSCEWVKCDTRKFGPVEGVSIVYAIDVTEALNPEALTISL